jgi:hypothetical protein
MKRKERSTHKNYVFEQVTFEKRKQLYSSNNILQQPDESLPASTQKYSMSETRTKFDFPLANDQPRKAEHLRFNSTVKAQSVPRQHSDAARSHFSHLTNHKDSIRSDEHTPFS